MRDAVLEREPVRAMLQEGAYRDARQDIRCDAAGCPVVITPGVSYYQTKAGARFCACCAEEAP